MRLRLNLGILICILLMAQTAFAHPEYAPGSMSGMTSGNTISGSNIVILQELIEVDISNTESVTIRESIVFRVTGNYTTDLMTWVPDGAINVLVSRQSMNENIPSIQIPHVKEGNIVRFNDSEHLSSAGMSMYAIQYLVPNDAENTVPGYTKILQYPAYINYPISYLTVKIIPAHGMELVIKDEGGNVIQGDNIETEDNAIIHSWASPQIKKISISTKPKSNITGILPYIAIGLIVLAILAFPFVQKKMKSEDDEVSVKSADTFKEDDKDDSGKYEDDSGEYEGYSEEYEDESDVEDDADAEEPDLDELETRYDAVLSLLNEIKLDRDKGDINDEEYETLSRKYRSEVIDLMKAIDELQDQPGQ